MLPRRAPQQHSRHSSRRGWCSIFALVSLALCVAMPFLWWQYSDVGATLQTPRATPLQRLQQQRAVGGSQQSQDHSATLSTRQQYSRGPAALGRGDSVTSEQVAAAQRYLQTTVQQPQPRLAVPASRYVIKPEPYDMRLQHKKVGCDRLTPCAASADHLTGFIRVFSAIMPLLATPAWEVI